MNQSNELVETIEKALEDIESYDDSYWQHYLRQNTIFDVDNIKSQKESLIKMLRALLEENKLAEQTLAVKDDTIAHLDSQLQQTREELQRYEERRQMAALEVGKLVIELEQVKAERDEWKSKFDTWMGLYRKLDEDHSTSVEELIAKDKVLEWYADHTNWIGVTRVAAIINVDGGENARSILSQYKRICVCEDIKCSCSSQYPPRREEDDQT